MRQDLADAHKARRVKLWPEPCFVLKDGHRILLHVARHYNLTIPLLKSPYRRPDLCRARYSAMWLMKKRTKLSLRQIARVVGRKDHTTVIHGLKRANPKECEEIML